MIDRKFDETFNSQIFTCFFGCQSTVSWRISTSLNSFNFIQLTTLIKYQSYLKKINESSHDIFLNLFLSILDPIYWCIKFMLCQKISFSFSSFRIHQHLCVKKYLPTFFCKDVNYCKFYCISNYVLRHLLLGLY